MEKLSKTTEVRGTAVKAVSSTGKGFSADAQPSKIKKKVKKDKYAK